MRSIRGRARQWAGNPSIGQSAIATAITIVCIIVVMFVGGFMTEGVSLPAAAVLTVGFTVVEILLIRLLTRRTR